MADGTIDGAYLLLLDLVPGPIEYTSPSAVPIDPAKCPLIDVTTLPDGYKVGRKIAYWNSGAHGTEGWSIFTIAKTGTVDTGVAIAAKTICVQDAAGAPFTVTNDADSCVNAEGMIPFVAVCALTAGDYSLFWTGGVCPTDIIKTAGGTYSMDGNYLTDAALDPGPMQVSDCAGDFLGFTVLAATGISCGYSDTADTNT